MHVHTCIQTIFHTHGIYLEEKVFQVNTLEMERSMLLPELSVELIGRFSVSRAASKATHSLPYKIRQQNQCMFTGPLLAERPSEASWHEY